MLGMPELLFHAPQTPLAVREEIIELAGAALRERPNPVGGAGLPPAAGGAVQGAEVTGPPPPGGGPAARSRAAPKSARPKNSPVKSAPRNWGSLTAEAFLSRRIDGASPARPGTPEAKADLRQQRTVGDLMAAAMYPSSYCRCCLGERCTPRKPGDYRNGVSLCSLYSVFHYVVQMNCVILSIGRNGESA